MKLKYTTITAPVGGRVGRRLVDAGNLVGYGESTLLATIMKVDPIHAYFSPTEADMQKLAKFRSKERLDAFIETGGDDDTRLQPLRLEGFVDFTDNTVDPLTSTVTMYTTIKNPDHTLYPGTFVYVNIFISDQYALMMVPRR